MNLESKKHLIWLVTTICPSPRASLHIMLSYSPSPRGLDLSYISAPTGRLRPSNVSFYSAPSSPCRENAESLRDLGSCETEPMPCEQEGSDLDHDFEFNASWGHVPDEYELVLSPNLESPLQTKQKPRGESLPSMAFADELFCDGKVMPLKPPPCFYNDGNRSGNQSPIAASPPRSPRSGTKFPFQRKSLWNDDFDPFMVALENVKGEDRARKTSQEGKNHRRTRSLSPFRAFQTDGPQRSKDSREMSHLHNGKETTWVPVQLPNELLDHTDSPFSTCVPSQRNQANLQQHKQDTTQSPEHHEPKAGAEKSKIENQVCNVRESKRQRIRKFLLGRSSSSSSSSSTESKQSGEKERAISKPRVNVLRRLSFKSAGSGATFQHNDEQRRVSTAAKMAVVQYRPRLFLCLGYGARRSRNER